MHKGKTWVLGLAAALIAVPQILWAASVAVVSVPAALTTMDPYDCSDTLSQAVAKSFYEGLFELDENNNVLPRLATSWHADASGRIYTLNLRREVTFSDGTPFNGEAVKINFERVANPANHLKRFGLYNNIDHVEVINDYQVKIFLKKPFSAFINQLAHPSGVMMSPTALQKYGSRGIGSHPVGTGPYTLVKFSAAQGMTVTKNPNYWRKGYPKLDGIEWKVVPDNNTRVNMLVNGQTHMATTLPLEEIDRIKDHEQITIEARPSVIQRYVSLNTRIKPFDNPRVRQALNFAINKEALVKAAFYGYAVPLEGVLPQGIEYNIKLGPWPYDPEKARRMLRDAGYPNGFESTLWATYDDATTKKILQFLQQELAQVGVKVTLRALNVGQEAAMVEDVQKPEESRVRMLYTGWSSSTAEADWGLRPVFATSEQPPQGANTAYYSRRFVDEGLIKALATTNRLEKNRLYTAIQRQIWIDAPWLFLVSQKNVYAHAKKLQDFYVMPDGSLFFENAHFE